MIRINPLKRNLLILLAFLITNSLSAQDNDLRVGYVDIGEIDFKGFTLSEDSKVNIDGYGASYGRWGNKLIFYGWIVESKSRKVVWNLLKEFNEEYFEEDIEGKFDLSTEISLPKGDYEVYYTGAMSYKNYNNHKFEFNDLGDAIRAIIDEIKDNDHHDYDNRFSSKLAITISESEGNMKLNDGMSKVDSYANNSIISVVRARDNESVKQYFSLSKETELNIYTIGEMRTNEDFDYARIVDATTQKQVWPNMDTDYKSAGGGKKNRSAFQTFTLPKGDYTIYYVSDDSHSFSHWNVAPPYDPQFWGTTLWTSKKDKNNVTLSDYNKSTLLSIDRVRNGKYKSQGFNISKSMEVQLISLGERSNHDDMADYGWIVNANTGETVWEFTERRSEYAGGGKKNRIITQKLQLDKGNYIAYYSTDDSHSYNNWNTAPPFAQDLWGLSLYAIDQSDKNNFKLVDLENIKSKNVIAEITHVRDDASIKREFTVDQNSKVRIVAIGEGERNSMFDTGWIRNNENGQIVWEMTYRNSRHAGGADKNRMFEGIVTLPKGEYTVYYETDDSHSYRDWNSTPPRNQERYGITIFKIN